MTREAPAVVVIRGVRAIDPTRGLDAAVDAVIERGVLTRLGPEAAAGFEAGEGAVHLEGRGRWLLPGLIDMHVHLREPGHVHKEDIRSGLEAAAAGGFTRVCAMPNTRPVNDCKAITELMMTKAREADGVALHPIGAITAGLEGRELAEMAAMRGAGAIGVSDDGRCVMSAGVMRRALEYAKVHDLVVIQHAEDHTMTEGAQMHEGATATRLGLRGWPREAEDVIVARDMVLAALTRARYHVAHLSSLGAVPLLREAKARGLRVSAEVTPHHLLLTDAGMLGYNTACKVNPPLREPADQEALWAALADGTIDAIATDHAPHSPLEKDCEISEAAPGMIGLELCLPLLVEQVMLGRLHLSRLIEALTAGPARVVGLPAPGLREGDPAELVLFDPTSRWVVGRDRLLTRSLNTPFLGREIAGEVLMTMTRGRVVHARMEGLR